LKERICKLQSQEKSLPRCGEHCSLLLPEKSLSERWIAAGLFIVSCLYLSSFCRFTTLDPDEGIVLQGAERILHGEVLYRDFFSFLTPGSYYLLALLFKTFGNSFIVARGALAVYGGVFSVFTYWMARRVCCRWTALLTAYLVTATCLPWRFVVLHNWDSTLCGCLAVYCAVLLAQVRQAGCAFVLGTFGCLTILFEQSKGVGLALGLLVGSSLLAWTRRAAISFGRVHKLALLAGFAWPLLLTLGYFASHHALGALVNDLAWPLRHYSGVNRVLYGTADWSDEVRYALFASGTRAERFVALVTASPCFVIPALPILAALLLIQWTVAARFGRLSRDRAAYYLIVASSICGALLSVIVTRPNVIHFVYLAPLFYLVLAWTIEGVDLPAGVVRALQPATAAVVLVTFTAVGMAFLISNRDARAIVETRRGALRTSEPDEMFGYVQAHVPANQRILIYPYFPLGYYLTATFSATRYEYLQPGMHTREQDEDVIRETEADRTAVVLFEPSFYGKIPTSWPNTPLFAIAVDPVADYILGHYHSCASLVSGAESRFAFMSRNGKPCPADMAAAQVRN